MKLAIRSILGISLTVFSVLDASSAFASCSRASTNKAAGDPLSSEQLRTLAEQSKTTLSRLTSLVEQLQQSLPATLPPPAEQALRAIAVHIAKGTKATEDALASGLNEQKLRFKLATLTSEVEISRSALTRFKLGLNGVDLSTTSRSNVEQLEKEIDDLRSALKDLWSVEEFHPMPAKSTSRSDAPRASHHGVK
jgi:hypothetical protein